MTSRCLFSRFKLIQLILISGRPGFHRNEMKHSISLCLQFYLANVSKAILPFSTLFFSTSLLVQTHCIVRVRQKHIGLLSVFVISINYQQERATHQISRYGFKGHPSCIGLSLDWRPGRVNLTGLDLACPSNDWTTDDWNVFNCKHFFGLVNRSAYILPSLCVDIIYV